jgi:HK97 family phage prohead protease
MLVERRFNKGAQVSAVAQRDGVISSSSKISGYAAVFNEEYVLFEDDAYRVVEIIQPGAFTPVLGDDVRCLFNHAPDNVIGRTGNGTLTMKQDSRGLRFSNVMDTKTTVGANVLQFVKRGDVTGCSFGFVVEEAEWSEATQADGRTVVKRTITKLKQLFDVGPVTYPAYEQTTVSA